VSAMQGGNSSKRKFRLMMVRCTTRETHTEMVDLLDRILDKGIVVDAWGLVFLAGVDLGIRVEARMVVASIDTYLKHADQLASSTQCLSVLPVETWRMQ